MDIDAIVAKMRALGITKYEHEGVKLELAETPPAETTKPAVAPPSAIELADRARQERQRKHDILFAACSTRPRLQKLTGTE